MCVPVYVLFIEMEVLVYACFTALTLPRSIDNLPRSIRNVDSAPSIFAAFFQFNCYCDTPPQISSLVSSL
jgi:hypothetical protein